MEMKLGNQITTPAPNEATLNRLTTSKSLHKPTRKGNNTDLNYSDSYSIELRHFSQQELDILKKRSLRNESSIIVPSYKDLKNIISIQILSELEEVELMSEDTL